MFSASTKSGRNSGAAPDAQFNYVTMLLHGDGTNGAQNNTFLDSSTNNFTITRNGNTTQGSFSPYGSNWSNYFDGSSYLNVASATASGSGNFCLEAWIYLTNITAQQQVIANATSGGMFLGINVNAANKLGIGRTFVAIDNEVSYTWVANTWYHIAVNRSGSSLQFFVNGTQVGATGSNSINYSTSGRQIGSESNGTSNFYGYISNLRCVNASVYTTTYTPSTTPLTAISGTTLLTCQSNRFIDNSSNAYAITATGTSVQRFNPFGTSTAYSTSVIGGSGYFDGSGDYLTSDSNGIGNFGTGDFTIECWFYTNDLANYRSIAESRTSNGTSTGWALAFNASGALYLYSNAFLVSTGTGVLKTQTWYHVAVARSSGTTRLFLNGSLSASSSTSRDYTDNNLKIATRYDNAGEYFNGYISNLRIVKGSAVYTSAFTPPTAPVTAVTNTSLLLNFTNGAIFDNAMMNDLETVGNAQISTSVKKYGTGSLYFDGTGDYLVANSGQGLGGDFTIEAWVYAVAFTGDARVIVDTRDVWSTSAGLNFYFNDTGNLIMYVNGGDRITSATAYSTATWYFVTLARSGSTITMYVNGTSVGTYTYSTALTDKSITIGTAIDNRSTGTAWHFNGYIDDLRITKGYARYTATFTPPTTAFPNTGPI